MSVAVDHPGQATGLLLVTSSRRMALADHQRVRSVQRGVLGNADRIKRAQVGHYTSSPGLS